VATGRCANRCRRFGHGRLGILLSARALVMNHKKGWRCAAVPMLCHMTRRLAASSKLPRQVWPLERRAHALLDVMPKMNGFDMCNAIKRPH
jgi:hypothetical protein